MQILKQHQLKWIGSFINVLYLTTPLLGMVAYVMNAVTMYTVIMPYIKPVVPWLTMPVFFTILFICFLLMLAGFYKFILPGYLAFQNKQQYIHKNPIQKDLLLLKLRMDIPLSKEDEIEAEALLRELERNKSK